MNILDVSAAANTIFQNSTIVLSNANGTVAKSISGNSNLFHNIVVDNANLTVNGENSFNKLTINGQLTLNGNNSLDSLRLSDVSTLTVAENTTQVLNNSFEALGSVGNLITIQSSGTTNGNLFADNNNIRFCFDYLDVVNISVSGATGFLSGDNSNINANSTGWIELDCDDALFPSFDIEFPCAMGQTRFIDTSTGFPTEWNWSFGNLQFPEENFSSQQNPFHNFRFEGEYEVVFNVKNNQFDETITRTVNIINYERGLGVPSININGSRLTSSVIAPNYQWYFNNTVIPGATDRIYEIRNPGLYHVTVSDENCLFLSDGTAVTSISQEQLSGNINIYPNPSSGTVNISLDSEINGQVNITIYDLLGNRIEDFSWQKQNEQFLQQFRLSTLSKGIYNVVLQLNGTPFVRKLVIAE